MSNDHSHDEGFCHVDKAKLEEATCPEWQQREQQNQRRLKDITDQESFLMGELEKIQGRLDDMRREAAMIMAGQEAARTAMATYAKYLQAPVVENAPPKLALAGDPGKDSTQKKEKV